MPLFQKSVINKFIKSQDTAKIEAAFLRFSAIFLSAQRQAEIRSMKEEEYQDGFLDDLFVNILGYIKRPNSGYNLVREKKNEADSKKADGAIIKNDSPLAVIELKGTDTTDLDKVTNQAFGYKNNHKECVYVIISNFEKLRFFIHHAVDYMEFNLFSLSKEEFTTLWLCLHSDNLLENIPAKIKAESVVKEEDITKNLYKDYSSFKQELWQDIVQLNPNGDPLHFYKKTQKLIDRFLFIFFAEDAGLLPPNSISRMVERWKMLKEEDAYKPLYDIFKQFFGYINTGRPGKTPQDEIFAYNGGLMAEDEILESLVVSDEVLLKHVSKLTIYDFSSDVDVNILGHIFENSLNDIEAVTAEIEGQEIDKGKTKRKKDGVFYTPKYITKYIVDHTVGKLCDEKKVELNIIDEEYAKGRGNRKKETIKTLDEHLQAYRNWLLNLTICDPACGSGAFLNQALEYLMEEHRYIDELESQLLGAGFIFPGVENHILENNLFGVDINEESIEIAKLSLWLRTAKRGRKLTSLNNNIKCGNSLIDDPEVAGEKAFSWEKEFPTVFKEKHKLPFHLTTAIHDSRTSERMIKYKARERRFDGTKPDREVFPMTKEEEELIAKTVAEIAKEDHLNIAAFNLCRDHMHILLVCEESEIPKIMRKIKGRTARACNQLRSEGSTPPIKGINPLDNHRDDSHRESLHKDGSTPFWTQKYHCKPITSDEQFWNTHNYIVNNKEKHNLPPNPKLEKIILGFVKTKEECFKKEYSGGFDVVIGNPPYVKLETIRETSVALESMNFQTFDKRGDLYVLFVEKGFEIVKEKGLVSYIMPNKWLQAGYGEKLRKYFLTKELTQLIDFGDIQIFEGATTYPVIFNARNNKPNTTFEAALLKKDKMHDFNFNVKANTNIFETEKFDGNTWIISSGVNNNLLERLSKQFKTLKEFVNGEANYGIKPGLTEAFIIDQETKERIIKSDPKSVEIIKPILRGRDILPWVADYSNYYLICAFPAYNLNIEDFPGVKDHLLSFGYERLEQSGNVGSRKKTSNKWFETQDTIAYHADFLKPKIMYQKFQVKPCFIYDEEGFFCNDSMWIIPTNNKALLGILNSKMGWWLTTHYCTQIQNGCQLIWKYFGQIPIPSTTVELTNVVENMLELQKDFQTLTQKLSTYISSQYQLEKLSGKLSSWHELNFSDFIKELNKAIKAAKGTPLTKKDEFEWMELFEENKKKALELKAKIDQTDKEIDRMVYELYGLTAEEIQIVENS